MVQPKFDSAETRKLVADLKKLEGGKPLMAALQKKLKAAADPIAGQVKGNASWSSRIRGAVSVGTSFSKRNTGVFIKVSAKKAPHARAYENKGKSGTFRHRVFGRDVWVSQAARPFLFSQAERNMPQVVEAAGRAVDEAARSAGFR